MYDKECTTFLNKKNGWFIKFIRFFIKKAFQILVGIALLFSETRLGAQCDSIRVSNIHIEGNEKTKLWVIKNEMRTHVNEVLNINALYQKLDQIQIDLTRTGLFADVKVSTIQDSSQSLHCEFEIVVSLKESWLFFPSIIFDIADRNYNVWWTEQNHSLDRVNYGLQLIHYNVSGRKDKLRLKMQTGYTNKYEFYYYYPYFSYRRNIGAYAGMLYAQSKEVDYKSENNKLVFYRNEEKIQLTRREFYIGLAHRPSSIIFHQYRLEYQYNNISDSIADRNRNFYGDGKRIQRHFLLSYGFYFNKLNHDLLPEKGYRLAFEFFLRRSFLSDDVRSFITRQEWVYAKKLFPRYIYSSVITSSQQILNNKQPYSLNKLLGYYNNIVYGYEYYVIDGTHMLRVEQNLRYKLFSYHKSFFKILKNEPRIKFKLDASALVNVSTAYVKDKYEDPSNELANRFLYSATLGGELGINNAQKLQLHLSVNHRREVGIFVHSKSTF